MEDVSSRQFDYETISDVILHLKYTAQDGGAALKTAAIENMNDPIINATENGRVLSILFNVKHEYSYEWHRFTSIDGTSNEITIDLSDPKDRLPFFAQNKTVEVTEVRLLAKKKVVTDKTDIIFNTDNLLKIDTLKLFKNND